MEPILLILDLDETLIHSTLEPLARPADFVVGESFHVYGRPGLEGLLDVAFSHFAVAVWTSATDDYAAEVVRRVFPDPRRLEFVWCRSRCTLRHDRDVAEEYWLKDLKKVRRRGFSLGRVLVVDDCPRSLSRHRGNLVAVSPFLGDSDDDDLPRLARYLPEIAGAPDVRAIDKRGWKNATPPAR